MRSNTIAIVALTLAVPGLSGCQSIFGLAGKAGNLPAIAVARGSAEYAAAQLEQGRQALDGRQYGAALVAFRNVQHFEQHAAAAHNGMAIAYAQIGRPDLAERYFRQAISEAPGDKRFHANLASFYRNWPEVAVRSVRPDGHVPAPAELAQSAIMDSAALAAADMPLRFVSIPVIQAVPARDALAASRRAGPQGGGATGAAQARSASSQTPAQPEPANPARVVALPNTRATIRIVFPESRSVRVSTSEVHIAMPQPRTADPRRRNPAVAAQWPALRPAQPVKPGYPTRIVFGTGR